MAAKKAFSVKAETNDTIEWKAIAAARGMSISDLINVAVEEHLKNHPLTADEQAIYDTVHDAQMEKAKKKRVWPLMIEDRQTMERHDRDFPTEEAREKYAKGLDQKRYYIIMLGPKYI